MLNHPTFLVFTCIGGSLLVARNTEELCFSSGLHRRCLILSPEILKQVDLNRCLADFNFPDSR